MGVHSFIKSSSLLALAATTTSALNIIQSNDDGWAEMYLRTFHSALIDAGYDALVSAPADNESARSTHTLAHYFGSLFLSLDRPELSTPLKGGHLSDASQRHEPSANLPSPGSLDADPTARTTACEYDSCAAGAATGTNASDSTLNWVNSYPATSMRYGLSTFAPAVWGADAVPDLAVTGPNVGSNIGFVQVEFSGTVGAACYAVDQGIPAIAFSGITEDRVAWDTLPVPLASSVYSDLALNLTNAIVAGGAPYLPDGVFLNVNLAGVAEGACASAREFGFVMSRINIPTVLSTADVKTCGDTWLPWEKDVVDAGCYVSVSVGTCEDKSDSSAANQQIVLDKLAGIIGCL